jgi:hypothetical protein
MTIFRIVAACRDRTRIRVQGSGFSAGFWLQAAWMLVSGWGEFRFEGGGEGEAAPEVFEEGGGFGGGAGGGAEEDFSAAVCGEG